MNSIIRKEFEQIYGSPPYGIYENFRLKDSEKSARYIGAKDAFDYGWRAAVKWQDEQLAMDRDYQLEMQENDRLRRHE